MNRAATARTGLVALMCVLAASCARDVHEPVREIAAPAPDSAAIERAVPDGVADTPRADPAAELAAEAGAGIHATPAGVEPQPDADADPEAQAAAAPASADDAIGAEAPAEGAARDANVAAPPVTAKVTAPAAPAGSQATGSALDFDALAKRLRKTKAIKLSDKLAFKGQSNALLEAFRAYHRRDGTTTLASLRQSYDRLFQDLHASLRERDPPLDRDVAESQAVLWDILVDPAKFVASDLMAGT